MELFSEAAQDIVHKFALKLQGSQNADELNIALNHALGELCLAPQVDRGLIWLVVNDRLTVTGSYSLDGNCDLVETSLNPIDSTIIVLQFMNISKDNTIVQMETESADQSWKPLLQLSEGFSSHLLISLRARGLFPGFLVLQSRAPKQWSDQDRNTIEKVVAVFALVIGLDFDLKRLSKPA